MMRDTKVSIPTLVRIKPRAIDRLGVYCRRNKFERVTLLVSDKLNPELVDRLEKSLSDENIELTQKIAIKSSGFEHALEIFKKLPAGTSALLGLGGGKALDVAKYVSYLSKIPYIAAPTALSNDGFSSPQSSLEIKGKRKSLPSIMPFGVVVDTEVCLEAPKILWLSGIGDLVAKITAVRDWKLAYRQTGTQIDDFAALLSDATVAQILGNPKRDLEGVKLLATALMLNGVAMEICGSSRPASGSEHLISHALDLVSEKPALHGLQVGVSTLLVSILQGQGTEKIQALFEATGFLEEIEANPFSKKDWIEAIKLAPTIKENYYTILSESQNVDRAIDLIELNDSLKKCFK